MAIEFNLTANFNLIRSVDDQGTALRICAISTDRVTNLEGVTTLQRIVSEY